MVIFKTILLTLDRDELELLRYSFKSEWTSGRRTTRDKWFAGLHGMSWNSGLLKSYADS